MDLKLFDRILTLGNLIGQAKLAYVEANSDLQVLSWNAGATNIFGYCEDETMGRYLYELVPITRRELTHCSGTQFKTVEYVSSAGEKIPCDLYYTAIVNTKGDRLGVAILCKDISSRLRDRRQLQLQQQYVQDVVGFAPIGIFHVNSDCRIEQANPEFAWMLGYESSEAVTENITRFWEQMFYDPERGQEFKNSVNEAEELTRFRCRLKRKDNTFVWALCYAKTTRDGNGRKNGFNGFAIDISEIVRTEQALKKAHDKLQMLAVMDGLTKIPNRRRFDEYLETEWRRAFREKKMLSVVLSDIDFFKFFNDTYGHQAGDDCLIQVAQAIQKSVHRASDLVARYGGEEFAMILPDTDTKGACAVAESARKAVEFLCIAHEASNVCSHVTLSLGVASMMPDDTGTPGQLVEMADKALYRAKENGRNQVNIGSIGI